jgi:hypothetical protein
MAMQKNWFRIEVFTPQETYWYVGSSPLDEGALLKALNSSAFIQLNDLTYFDEEGRPRRWTEWDPHCQPTIHINPRYVLSILPLVGDPHKKPGDSSKVLHYPRPDSSAPKS